MDCGGGVLPRTSSVPDHQRQLPEKRPDPVREVWPEMLVKIADLGNACWVVSVCVHHNLFISFRIMRNTTRRKVFLFCVLYHALQAPAT